MFDITRITEAVGGLVGQASANFDTDGLTQQLSDAGLDLQQLEGLDTQQLTDLLESSGIDIANIDVNQLSEMAGQFSESTDIQSIGDLLSNLTQRS